jgi:hypothetical protein
VIDVLQVGSVPYRMLDTVLHIGLLDRVPLTRDSPEFPNSLLAFSFGVSLLVAFPNALFAFWFGVSLLVAFPTV